ncbi:hypothetical protein [Streptomyces sp. NPDC059489]|uniref:HNH endonuclease n=1 Tax=Streptomyces sp. NPDC059489 TaxID=3346849 RepID=UPI0036819647
MPSSRRTAPPRRSTWARTMAARRRKTLVVCRHCHEDIHAGRPTRSSPRTAALESRVR